MTIFAIALVIIILITWGIIADMRQAGRIDRLADSQMDANFRAGFGSARLARIESSIKELADAAHAERYWRSVAEGRAGEIGALKQRLEKAEAKRKK